MPNQRLARRHQRLLAVRRRNIVVNVVCIAVTFVIMVWALHLFWRYVNYEITNDAMIEQYVTPLSVRASGYVKDIRFAEHQHVKKGDTLLVLNDSEYRIAVDKARAALAEAMAERNTEVDAHHTAEATTAVQQATLDETLSRLSLALHTYNRQTILKNKNIIGEQTYEQAQTDYHSELKHATTLRRQLDAANRQTKETADRIATATSAIEMRRSDLQQALLEWSYCVVTAPYDGEMGRRSIDVGQEVRENQTITNIIRPTGKWVTANYRETQIANIRIGQQVRIHVDAFPNRTFHGRVTAISAATGSRFSLVPTDNSAGNFVKVQQRIPVRISIDDASAGEMAQLRAGMMVEVEALKR